MKIFSKLFIATAISIILTSTAHAVEKAEVVFYKSGCSYFIADGPSGFYLMEWYGGHDPSEGDIMIGDINSYGFKDVYYANQNSKGTVYIEDYYLSKSRVIEKYYKKCKR